MTTTFRFILFTRSPKSKKKVTNETRPSKNMGKQRFICVIEGKRDQVRSRALGWVSQVKLT